MKVNYSVHLGKYLLQPPWNWIKNKCLSTGTLGMCGKEQGDGLSFRKGTSSGKVNHQITVISFQENTFVRFFKH